MLAGHKTPHAQAHSGPPRRQKPPGVFARVQQGFERRFDRFRDRYNTLLEQAVAHRVAFVNISLAVALGSFGLYYINGRDFFPEIKSGTLQMHIRITSYNVCYTKLLRFSGAGDFRRNIVKFYKKAICTGVQFIQILFCSFECI